MSLAFDAQASASAGGFGGPPAVVSLTGIATGSLMLLWATGGSGITAPIADPAGWTRIVRASVGSNPHWLGYRVKQAGDTSVTIGGGSSTSTLAAVCAYSGIAAFSEVSTLASTTPSGSTVDPTAVTINDANSMSVVVAAGASPQSVLSPSAGWTERVDTVDGSSTVMVEISDRGPGLSAGSLDPAAMTFSGSTANIAAYQIELVPVGVAVALAPSAGQATGALAVTPGGQVVPLTASAAAATATLTAFFAGGQSVPLAPSAAHATPTLALETGIATRYVMLP